MSISDYTPLCDVKNCSMPQCGEIVEAEIKTQSLLSPTIRIHPCSICLQMLKGIV